jgi:predicted AAA-ATPase/PD-(D/E)XK nuclease superfamily protein
MGRPIPIGISDFKELIDNKYAYVDKTLLIKEILEKGSKVALIPRLRRFGKTLNLSMLRYFFEKTKKETAYLFKDLKIWQDEKSRSLQGQFPVIFISLKDIKHASWEETFTSLKRLVSEVFRAHPYLLKSDILDDAEKEDYETIASRQGDQPLYEQSLKLLTKWLSLYHKMRVILLIDEYDTPAHAAYIGGYYKELIDFLRNWLSGGLKDNSCLEKGVLTGILRIAKESIFSGLNNIDTFTILSEGFQDKFGLTETEVKKLLEEYKLLDKWTSIQKWYNGYRIGSCAGIYNPWSVLNCIAKKGVLSPYWVNTSDNALMKQLITQGTEDLKADIEELLKGGTIEKTIEEALVFSELDNNPDAVWSLLLFSGYLSLAAPPMTEAVCQLRIPNNEVRGLYHSIILKWFKQTIREEKYKLLLQSLVIGDVATFSEIFKKFLLDAFSFFDVSADEPEKIYHSFVLGMLVGLQDRYEVKSNRESGYGRYDVMLIPKNRQELGIVIEFKKIGNADKGDLELAATAALQQIEDRQYDVELKNRGINRILHLGMAFKGKNVVIRSKT